MDAPDHGDKGRKHDGIVAGGDPGQIGEVVRDRPGAHARRRLGPGVDDVEAGMEHERRQECPDVGMEGVGHGQRKSAHPAG